MKISAGLRNSGGKHEITLKTNESVHSIEIPPKTSGAGSGVNGGELLFLALATCYCNDVYREAGKKNVDIESIDVDVEGEFGAEGQPARNVTYRARVTSHGNEREIRELLKHTDTVAEIQNTLRASTPVTLSSIEITTKP